jgi:hypothetical protein
LQENFEEYLKAAGKTFCHSNVKNAISKFRYIIMGIGFALQPIP